MAKGVATSEKQLQRQIVSLLQLKGIQVNVSRMDKRKTDAVGWPDITFAIESQRELLTIPGKIVSDGTVACAWEVKMPQGKLTPGQEKLATALSRPPNLWRHRVIRSVDQAISELKSMGIS